MIPPPSPNVIPIQEEKKAQITSFNDVDPSCRMSDLDRPLPYLFLRYCSLISWLRFLYVTKQHNAIKLKRTDHPVGLHVSIPKIESKLLDPLIKFTAIESNVKMNISRLILHWLFEQLSLLKRSSSSSSSIFNLSMIITSVCSRPLFQTESSSCSAKPLLSLSRMARPSLIHILLPLMKVSPTR